MKLINDNILVERITEIERDGILIPLSQSEIEPRIGTVRHIGDCKDVEVGQKVIYPHYINKIINYDGIDLHLMKVSDVMGVVSGFIEKVK